MRGGKKREKAGERQRGGGLEIQRLSPHIAPSFIHVIEVSNNSPVIKKKEALIQYMFL